MYTVGTKYCTFIQGNKSDRPTIQCNVQIPNPSDPIPSTSSPFNPSTSRSRLDMTSRYAKFDRQSCPVDSSSYHYIRASQCSVLTSLEREQRADSRTKEKGNCTYKIQTPYPFQCWHKFLCRLYPECFLVSSCGEVSHHIRCRGFERGIVDVAPLSIIRYVSPQKQEEHFDGSYMMIVHRQKYSIPVEMRVENGKRCRPMSVFASPRNSPRRRSHS